MPRAADLVTVRYKDGTAAVHSDLAGAVAQSAHSLWLPMQGEPVAVFKGDITADHVDESGNPRALKDLGEPLLNAKDLQAAPACACNFCEMERKRPKLEKLRAQIDAVLEESLLAPEAQDQELKAWLQNHPKIKGGTIPAGGFRILWSAVALTAATAKTIVQVVNAANNMASFSEISVNGDATSGNLLVELVFGTNATNPPGTNSTSFTPLLVRGATQTLNSTAGVNWTAEPTVLTVLGKFRMPWPGGPLLEQFPLSREISGITAAGSGKAVGFRLTSSVTANTDGHVEVEE